MKKIYFILVFTFLFSNIFAQGYNVELLDSVIITDRAQGIWGYTKGGNEYAIIGIDDAADNVGFKIYDVTNPYNITYKSTFSEGSRTHEVKTYIPSDGKVYAISVNKNADDIFIVNVDNPDNISEVATIPIGPSSTQPARAHDLYIYEDVLYLACENGLPSNYIANLVMYDISDPTDPGYLGRWRIPNQAMPSGQPDWIVEVFVKNNRIYIAGGRSGAIVATYYDQGGERHVDEDSTWLITYDNLRSASDTLGSDFRVCHTVKVTDDENYLFVCDELTADDTDRAKQGAVLRIFDISDIENFTPINNPSPANFLNPDQLYDVPESDSEGTIVTPPDSLTDNITIANGIHKVFLDDGNDLAYVAYYTKGLRILDISDPTDIEEIGYYDTHASASASDPDKVWSGSWGVYPFFDTGVILVSDLDGLRTFARIPAIPTNFYITGSVGQHPTLHWNSNTEHDLDGYNIYVNYHAGSWEFLHSVNKNTTSWTDNGVTITGGKFDPLVCYRITAFNIVGLESDYSRLRCKKSNELSKPFTNSFSQNIPTENHLSPAYPNPFNPTTKISYSLKSPGEVELVIYDLNGKIVKNLVDGYLEAGYYSVIWDGKNDLGISLPSGLYIYRLKARDFSQSRKVLLVK